MSPIDRVTSFKGPFYFLSNFFASPVEFEGHLYSSVEHAYVAAKTLKPEMREQIRSVILPGEVKRLGRRIELRPDWEDVKVDIMRSLLASKFGRSPKLTSKLLTLRGTELIEGNTWGDRIWGAVQNPHTQAWEGQNLLGKLLMELIRKLTEVPLES